MQLTRPGEIVARMTPQEKRLVQESFALVEPIAETAAALFYRRLFELDPDLRPLFKRDLPHQGRMLMQVLTIAVRGLDDLDRLVPVVETLGRRHVAYGVEPEHYDTVGQALLWTLETGLGNAFTSDVRDAWITVYSLLATVMQRGAANDEVLATAA
jgi:hemoglobin-like flavoprotein